MKITELPSLSYMKNSNRTKKKLKKMAQKKQNFIRFNFNTQKHTTDHYNEMTIIIINIIICLRIFYCLFFSGWSFLIFFFLLSGVRVIIIIISSIRNIKKTPVKAWPDADDGQLKSMKTSHFLFSPPLQQSDQFSVGPIQLFAVHGYHHHHHLIPLSEIRNIATHI